LNAGTNVTIATSNGTGAGNINVSASIQKTLGSSATLTLRAHNDIVMANNVSITSTSERLHVVLHSNSDNTGAGAIVMHSGSTISSNGGNITMGGGDQGITAGNDDTPAIGFAKGSAVSGRVTGIALINATVSANGPEGQEGGSIIMNGQGSDVALGDNSSMGVDIQDSRVTTNRNGSIHINGKGGTGGHTNVGIGVRGRGDQEALIQGGSTGLVRLIGTGGIGGDYNFGVWVSDLPKNRVTTLGGS
jgi:hypothetical protein